jgi:putative Ca2+/H+ antiporter (TMEM165/GDT1 family)
MKEKVKELGLIMLRGIGDHVFILSALLAAAFDNFEIMTMFIIAAFYLKLDDIKKEIAQEIAQRDIVIQVTEVTNKKENE